MTCILHKRTDCCTVPVTNTDEMKKRLEHLVRIDELNIKFKLDGEEKDKILDRIGGNRILLESL